jgi:Carboxypeptidase regulatory-like domain
MTVVFYILLLLTEHHGQVIFNGVPVPGATVTATQGEKKFVAVTDQQGAYSFPELADGPFTVQVEMLGFSTLKQEVNAPAAEFELKMLPIEDIQAEIAHGTPADPPPTPAPSAATPSPNNKQGQSNTRQAANQPRQQTGFQRTEVNASNANSTTPSNDPPAPPQSSAFANLSQEELNQRAADGLLINGTVNNGAASPFAQAARIGNNLRGRPLYTGNASVVVDNSVFDARSYSLTGQNTAKPAYNRFTGSFNVGGPLRIPHLIRNNAPTFFLGYQRAQNRNANTLTGRMPTAAERNGDFSQSVNPLGQSVQLIDPTTGLPFSENIIPEDKINPQARALLNLFPLPNFNDKAGYNYQIPVADATHSDIVQGRLNKAINARNQIVGTVDITSARSDNSNLFHFLDTSRTFGINSTVQWTTRPRQRFSATFRLQFSRQTARITPHFANRINVSGIAGITGNNQEAINWGPPTLNFAGGTSTLSDVQSSFNRTQNTTVGYNSFWNRGRHNVTFGGDVRFYRFNVLSQQDARGTFTFTGAAAGSDFAGFLLGIPDTTSIAFGNADKYFRQRFYNAFIADDWRMTGSLTINAGLRWEYEGPTSELQGRLVNLNIVPDFSSITPVVGNGLIHTDRLGIQPRVSFAWRPIAASSLIVRGAYGIYRNTNVYQVIATQMAQQSPLSKSLSVQNSAANPLTLANGFLNVPGITPNTFAIDPNFRVGYVQNWQLSIQRDLPAALQMTAMYLGTKGTRLPQEFLPNTFPSGAVTPSGYVYLTSNGNSIRHAGQIQLRRRLRNGFTATTQYTYSKALDNAPLMAGGIVTANQGSTSIAQNQGGTSIAQSQAGTSIAQNWLDLRAERALSSFDQRHQFSVQTQYTTGVGVRGGALLGGWRGVLFKEWTLASQLNMGSGLPQTPIYFAAVRGTGVTGNLRPDFTGVSIHDAPPGLFLNPAAFRVPAAGQWGNAGRNSITGPSQFSLNASLGRSFPWRDRYNIDVRLDATNVLNHVTFKNWNTTVTSAQFGLPVSPNAMRSIQTIARLRF